MNRYTAIERLKELLSLECRSLGARAGTIEAFVTRTDSTTADVVKRICAEDEELRSRLAAVLIELGEIPAPQSYNMECAGAHYVDMRRLADMLIHDLRERIAACERIAPAVASEGAAARVVGELLAAHQSHLTKLEQLTAQSEAAPAAHGVETTGE